MKRFKKCYIEITNLCNLACSFCPGTRRAPRSMPAAEFEIAAGQAKAFTDYINLHLLGEPLLHPELPAILDIAARLDLKVNVTTNGTLLAKAGSALLASPAVRKVSISLHSLEANGEKEANGYLENVASLCKAGGSKLIELRLWNAGGENGRNAAVTERLSALLGAPVPLQSGRIAEGLYLSCAEQFEWGSGRAEEQSLPAAFCYGLRDQFGILADGTVVPCCLDADGEIALGNLFTAPLAEILDCARARALYRGFTEHTAVEPLCRRCGYAKRFSK